MRLASTFISYEKAQARFAEDLAAELGRRGVSAWFDKDRIVAGDDLNRLRDAVQQQEVFTVLLTRQAIDSEWVNYELKAVFDKIGAGPLDAFVPVCFSDDPVALLREHPLLRTRCLDPTGSRCTIRLINVTQCPDGKTQAGYAAEELSRSVFKTIAAPGPILAIGIDVRGTSTLTGRPKIPPIIRKEDAKVLVFRPDRDERSGTHVLCGPEWEDFARDIKCSIGRALQTEGCSLEEVYIFGQAQLGIPYWLGREFFHRQVPCPVHGYNAEDDKVYSFDFRQRRQNLPACADPRVQPANLSLEGASRVALYVGPRDYKADVERYLKAHRDTTPFAWLIHDQLTPEEAPQLIAEVKSFLANCRSEGAGEARLFCYLPFGMMPLLGAHLENVMNGQVQYMEYRKDIRDQATNIRDEDLYIPLTLPRS